MSNTVITIGNTNASDFADWLDSEFHYTGGATIIDAIGFYNGERESSVQVTFYDRTPDFAKCVLNRYGVDHPDELCFGILDSTFSVMYDNPSHIDSNSLKHWGTIIDPSGLVCDNPECCPIVVPDTLPKDWS